MKKNRKSKLITWTTFVLLLLFSISSYAQKRSSISGTLKDELTGETLIGATGGKEIFRSGTSTKLRFLTPFPHRKGTTPYYVLILAMKRSAKRCNFIRADHKYSPYLPKSKLSKWSSNYKLDKTDDTRNYQMVKCIKISKSSKKFGNCILGSTNTVVYAPTVFLYVLN